MNRLNFYMNVIRDGLQYAIFECGFLILLLFDARDGVLSDWLLIPGVMLATIWMIATHSAEAIEEAREMVLHRELFMSDFIISAIVLILIAIVVRGEHVAYPIVFGLAAVQNLRYSTLARRWIMESIGEQRDREHRSGGGDDHMR